MAVGGGAFEYPLLLTRPPPSVSHRGRPINLVDAPEGVTISTEDARTLRDEALRSEVGATVRAAVIDHRADTSMSPNLLAMDEVQLPAMAPGRVEGLAA